MMDLAKQQTRNQQQLHSASPHQYVMTTVQPKKILIVSSP
jgi:hypothetical protein